MTDLTTGIFLLDKATNPYEDMGTSNGENNGKWDDVQIQEIKLKKNQRKKILLQILLSLTKKKEE